MGSIECLEVFGWGPLGAFSFIAKKHLYASLLTSFGEIFYISLHISSKSQGLFWVGELEMAKASGDFQKMSMLHYIYRLLNVQVFI